MKKILIGILIGLLVGIGSLFAYNEFFEKEKSNKTNNSKKEEATEETEKEITDNLLIKDLTNKVIYLNTKSGVYNDDFYINNLSNNSYKIDLYFMRENLYNDILTTDDKLDITLNSLLNEFSELTVSSNEIQFNEKQNLGEYLNEYVSEFRQINVEKVENRYYDLFGEKINEFKDIKNCPAFYYDSKNKMYYYVRECGGTTPGYAYLYQNRFTQKSNKAYVYVNLGMYFYENLYNDFVGDIDNNISKYSSNIYKSNVSEEEFDDFKIDESNYKNFSEYKFTFTKNSDGNYYFESVEKIN